MTAGVPARVSAVTALLLLAASSVPVRPHGGNGVDLRVQRGPGADEVTLAWDGGQPMFEVFRSPNPDDVLDLGNKLGETADRTWTDLPPPGALHFYQIDSPCMVDPPERCDGIDNDCDGAIDEPGAEDYCALPNASALCADGSCQVDQCSAGFSDCDGSAATGCEVDHGSVANSCSAAEYVGSTCGDTACGLFCPGTSWQAFATRTGRTSRWFRVHASECSGTCCADVYARVTLTPPPGTDYDLYVYSSCGVLWDSSQNGTGATDQVTVFRQDDCLSGDQSFDYWIEVRHYGGASCLSWALTIEGTSC